MRNPVEKEQVVLQKLSTSPIPEFSHFAEMTMVEIILKEASKLDFPARAELVSSLLEDLDLRPHCVSDEEAFQRLQELKSGTVVGLSNEEFW